MSQPGKYYSLHIPTKTYLRKYITSIYGDPIVINTSHYFGLTIIAFLERKFFFRQKQTVVHQKFDVLNDQLTIKLPTWWMKQSHFGTDIPQQSIIYINKLFEERFEEDLSKFCAVYNAVGVEYKDAREEFCKLYNIELEEDITGEALKKKEYRYRENSLKNFIAKLSPEKIPPIDGLLLYPTW
jgi:hypothetical protein